MTRIEARPDRFEIGRQFRLQAPRRSLTQDAEPATGFGSSPRPSCARYVGARRKSRGFPLQVVAPRCKRRAGILPRAAACCSATCSTATALVGRGRSFVAHIGHVDRRG